MYACFTQGVSETNLGSTELQTRLLSHMTGRHEARVAPLSVSRPEADREAMGKKHGLRALGSIQAIVKNKTNV